MPEQLANAGLEAGGRGGADEAFNHGAAERLAAEMCGGTVQRWRLLVGRIIPSIYGAGGDE